MITKISPIILKRALDSEGQFDGLASTFGGLPDVDGDVFLPGAFRSALELHRRAGTKPALLWNHAPSEPVGVWAELSENAAGLYARGQLTLGVARGREAHALLLAGALAMSIGFSLKPEGSRRRGAVREITKVERLIEISLTPLPANSRAKVEQVKSLPTTPREFERFLREVGGFSHRQAKGAVSAGWRGIARDERVTDLDMVLSKIEDLRSLIEDLK